MHLLHSILTMMLRCSVDERYTVVYIGFYCTKILRCCFLDLQNTLCVYIHALDTIKVRVGQTTRNTFHHFSSFPFRHI